MCTKSHSSQAYQQNSESVHVAQCPRTFFWNVSCSSLLISSHLAKDCLSLCLLVFQKQIIHEMSKTSPITYKTQMLSIQNYRFEYIYFIYTNPYFRLLILVWLSHSQTKILVNFINSLFLFFFYSFVMLLIALYCLFCPMESHFLIYFNSFWSLLAWLFFLKLADLRILALIVFG